VRSEQSHSEVDLATRMTAADPTPPHVRSGRNAKSDVKPAEQTAGEWALLNRICRTAQPDEMDIMVHICDNRPRHCQRCHRSSSSSSSSGGGTELAASLA